MGMSCWVHALLSVGSSYRKSCSLEKDAYMVLCCGAEGGGAHGFGVSIGLPAIICRFFLGCRGCQLSLLCPVCSAKQGAMYKLQ